LLDAHDLGGRPCAIDVARLPTNGATSLSDGRIGGSGKGTGTADGNAATDEQQKELVLLLGLANGEVTAFYPSSGTLVAFNTGNTRVCTAKCVAVAWTASPSRFIAAHANGAMYLHDVSAADASHRTAVGTFESVSNRRVAENGGDGDVGGGAAAGTAAAATLKSQRGAKRAGNPVRTWRHVTVPVTAVGMSSAKTHSASGDAQGRLWVRRRCMRTHYPNRLRVLSRCFVLLLASHHIASHSER
jgi:hypothetical protein